MNVEATEQQQLPQSPRTVMSREQHVGRTGRWRHTPEDCHPRPPPSDHHQATTWGRLPCPPHPKGCDRQGGSHEGAWGSERVPWGVHGVWAEEAGQGQMRSCTTASPPTGFEQCRAQVWVVGVPMTGPGHWFGLRVWGAGVPAMAWGTARGHGHAEPAAQPPAAEGLGTRGCLINMPGTRA